MSTVRSNEQLLFLLKLVDVNQVETKRRNVNVRHKIWNGIAEKLNRLSANGAEKDADGWKRCFKTWRLSEGPDYKMKMQELIKTFPSDGSYLITVSEDEEETKDNIVEKIVIGDPMKQQQQLLHELVLKHKILLLSTADDEPLKVQLWQNIAEQLNTVSGALTLTPVQWKQSVDLDKYRTKRGRKPLKRAKTIKSESCPTNSSKATYDETTQPSTSSQCIKKENSTDISLLSIEKLLEEVDDNDDDDENFIKSDPSSFTEDDDTVSEPEDKRFRPSPLVNNFKFSSRMVNAIEQLRDDVQCVNNTIKETADCLNSIRNILERQCEQQDEQNALLKRSSQYLKVLLEFKIGKRTSVTKRNFHSNHETEGQ